MLNESEISLYTALFKGRTDVYALRWEKESKSGYMPAYDLNWNEYNAHKAKGGTFQNFKNKSYKPLTENYIEEHLNGKQTIGMYPLLQDNTSWFIAADFDEKNWFVDCQSFLNICQEYEIPAYLERSRSGNGGHVWIFFEENYPAIKSRAIVKDLLNKAKLSLNNKGSFDRLFPNQDSHSGLGFGNLIALPLQGYSVKNGNSCFVDSEGNAIEDQWKFLESINKISSNKLDELWSALSSVQIEATSNQEGLCILLNNQIVLNRNAIPDLLMKFIKEQLQFVNQEFLVKKKFSKSTYKTEPTFKLFTETESTLTIPRGFAGKLIRFCKENSISFELEDQRRKLPETNFNSKIKLRDTQEGAIEKSCKKDFGIIVAPPGSGKTIIGLEIVARKKQPALIIVHRQQLFDQWLERIENFLGIPKYEIGQINGSVKSLGKQITVAMLQSLGSVDLFQKFGNVIIDECHHIPAKTFREAVQKISSYYMYGLTATPKRKYNDESLLYSYIGDIIVQLNPSENSGNSGLSLSIIIRETDFYLPFNSATDSAELLLNSLTNDTQRNQLIAQDVAQEVRNGKRVLVLTERKAHVQLLNQYMKSDFDVICMNSEDSKKEREYKLGKIHSEEFQILISTGQLLGEGIDIPELDSLFLVFPFSFEGKLIQYIGRLQRGGNNVTVFDYRDKKISYLENQFRQRNRYYNTIRDQSPLQDGEEVNLYFDNTQAWLDNENNLLSLSQLDIPEWIGGFKSTCWKLRIIKYNPKVKSVLVEVLDYNAQVENFTPSNLRFEVERIVFKHLEISQIKKFAFNKSDIKNETLSSRKEQFELSVLFDDLRFDSGYVFFHRHILQLGKTVKVRIDNEFIRPEFEIIREYFKKLLRLKTILVTVEVDYKESKVVSCLGISKEIDRINSSIIDTVKFEFFNSKIKSGKEPLAFSIIDQESLSEDLNKIFDKETDLLNVLLEASQPRHYKQLKFLSKKHCYKVVKLRFILEPFSFIFLLEGDFNYHIAWETLDTEEATYLWHISKEENLQEQLLKIDLQISKVTQEGKFIFLESNPDKFSRVYHDYSELDKGFLRWKDQVNEFLI